MTDSSPPDDREERLDSILASYLKAVDQGASPDRRALLARHPDLAEELAAFFQDEDRFGAIGASGQTNHDLPLTSESGEKTAFDLNPAPASRARIVVGSIVDGAYEVFGIGTGGMGSVYFARHLDPGPTGGNAPNVALKTIPDFDDYRQAKAAKGIHVSESDYTHLSRRFRREAMIWVRLGWHDNIARAIMVIDVGQKPFLVMEYIGGGDLRNRIKTGPLPPALTTNLARQCCEGMRFAFSTAGLVHRDIKPANLLLTDEGVLKIADFGLAKTFDTAADTALSADAKALSLDRESLAAIGTRGYMAPEQFLGLRHADTRSDIFSVGVTMYEMLTGLQLFAAADSDERAARNDRLPLVHEINPTAPPSLSAIVDRCLRYDPAERYQSFAALAADLATCDESLVDRIPIPAERRRPGPEVHTASFGILAETYSLLALGESQAAAERAQRGIDTEPENAEHWINKGRALANMKRYDEALGVFIRAARLTPDDAAVWANVAWMTLATGGPAEALRHATAATELDEDCCDAWSARGRCELDLENLSDAIRSLRRAVELEPHNWKALVYLGACLVRINAVDEALDLFSQAVAVSPDSAALWYEIALAHGSRRAFDEASVAIDRCILLDGSDARAWALRALFLWEGRNDVETAQKCLDKALELDPGTKEAYRVRAAINISLMKRQQFDAAPNR